MPYRTASPFIRDRTMEAERSIVTELTQLMKTLEQKGVSTIYVR